MEENGNEKRIGRQEPTQEFILPYEKTLGPEAVELYNRSKIKQLYEWQKSLLYDIMAVDDDGMWTHMKFGLSIPRQNGKTELVICIMMWALEHGEHILYTSHRTDTSHSIFLRLSADLDYVGVEKSSEYKAFGKEHIYLPGGGQVEFRTRTNTQGLGLGYDCIINDESQELTPAQDAAMMYCLAAAKNPQTIMIGTPPTPTSSGTVFLHYREDVLGGQGFQSGWAEWSVDKMSPLDNEDLWYETNPSLGLSLPIRNIRAEMAAGSKDKVIDLNIQRLGLWLTFNLQSAISPELWKNLEVKPVPELKGPLYVGVKFGQKEHTAALAIGVRTKDGRIYLECIDDRPLKAGVGWIVDFLKQINYDKLVLDGESGRYVLEDAMKQAKLPAPKAVRVADFIKANTEFETALENKTICHSSQGSVEQIISNVKKRAIGKTGWGYESQREGIDDALLDSMILAHWLINETPEPTGKPYAQISY